MEAAHPDRIGNMNDSPRAQLTVEDLRAELDAYERRYGVSSERRIAAFPESVVEPR